MSAQALKELTTRDVRKMQDEIVTNLIERTQDTLDQMRLNQGIVIGMRMTLDAMETAYKKIGE